MAALPPTLGRVLRASALAWPVVLLLGAGSARAVTSADAIARVNALRAVNGIPGDVVEDATLDAGCQAHVAYAALNGGFDRTAPHDEVVGKPGYSPEGAAAAGHSVLANGAWSDPNPWWTAPYHLQQVLDPALTVTGFAQQGGFLCLQTLTQPRRALPNDAIFTFPGAGAANVPFEERATELDDTGSVNVPGQTVGLPAGTLTGPYLIVWAGDSRQLRSAAITSASLAGPRGPVAIALAADWFLIPRAPLAPSTSYTALVNVHFSGVTCERKDSTSHSLGIPPCPADVPSYCSTDPATAALLHIRTCDPGEPQPTGFYTYPDQDVAHQWTFTTAAPPPPVIRRLRISDLRARGPLSLRALRASRALRVRCTLTATARLIVTLADVHGRLLGRATRRAAAAGVFQMRLPVRLAALRRLLAHHRRATALLRVEGYGPDARRIVHRTILRLRR